MRAATLGLPGHVQIRPCAVQAAEDARRMMRSARSLYRRDEMPSMIVKDEQRVVMEFIATANRGGYRPASGEINEWRRCPDARPRRRGKLLQAAVPEIPERRVRKGPSWFESVLGVGPLAEVKRRQNILGAFSTSYLSTINRSFDVIGKNQLSILRDLGMGAEYEFVPGRQGQPARYGQGKPAEKFLAHLRRLGWIERDTKGGHGVTRLGHSLLRAEAAADGGDEDASVMVLAAEDELAYGRVLGVISECGEALIMDTYLGAGELVHILKDSNASRFLVSSKLKGSRLTQLALMIRLTPPGAGGVVRELRCADFHDRYLIGEDRVYGLGSSLNGVGKNLTTLIHMPDLAAQSVRAEAERLWADGDVIAYTDEHIAVDDDASDDAHTGVLADDARFRHNGCSVRHRSQQAVENCTRGSKRAGR